MRIARTTSSIVFVTFYLQIVRIVCVATVVYGLKYVSPYGPCNPGELVFVGFCNLCLCNSQGVPNQLCAKSWCPVQTPLPPQSSMLNNLTANKPFA